MLIFNNTKHVIVLKAFREPRLFCKPGKNPFDIKSLAPYKKSKAACGYFKSEELAVMSEASKKSEAKSAKVKADKEIAESKEADEKADKEKADAIEAAKASVTAAEEVFKTADKKADKDAASIALASAQEALKALETE